MTLSTPTVNIDGSGVLCLLSKRNRYLQATNGTDLAMSLVGYV